MRKRLLGTTIVLVLAIVAVAETRADKPVSTSGLIAYWPLAENALDVVGELHGEPTNVRFASNAAFFNGRDSVIQVRDAEALRLGKRDFSVGLWIKCETPMRSTMGDLINKFDPVTRRGLNLHLAGSSPGYSAMSDTRHVHFGIDDGHFDKWKDCGKPCASNTLITCLIAFNGELYCGIADADHSDDKAHVFRYAGGREWVDCGRLGSNPDHYSVQSMIVHRGKLYAGTGMWDWEQASGGLPGKPAAAPTHVFGYEGGMTWRDLGQVGDGTRVLSLCSFNGELFAGLDSAPTGRGGGRVYRYDGHKWIDCGAPDGRNLECFLPLRDKLYAATHRNVFQYDGDGKWTSIGNGSPFGITQIHSMEAVQGKIVIGTWPQGYVLRYDGDGHWSKIGQLGLPNGQPPINEINDLTVYNGKLYAGAIPKAEVYRYDGDDNWTRVGNLAHRSDWDAEKLDTWLRVTCMASFRGKLFAGTGSCQGRADVGEDSSLGCVYATQAGQVVSYERDIGGEWTHLSAIRCGPVLSLYVNGELAQTSRSPDDAKFDITNQMPLWMGFGQQSHFHGWIREVRIYNRAIDGEEIARLFRDGDYVSASSRLRTVHAN
ncbi:MAG: LamG-like jellyroll fold domain-containing protein [Pirellulales bacterium]